MQKLKELLWGLCATLEGPDAEHVVRTGSLAIDDIPVSLNPAGPTDPDAVHAYYALGALPEEGVEAVLRRMLQLNLCLFSRDAVQFGLDPASGQPVMMVRLDVSDMDAGELHQALSIHATLAGTWQDTRFGDGVLEPGLGEIRQKFLAEIQRPAAALN